MSKWRSALLGGGVLLVVLGASLWLGSSRPASGEGGAVLSVSPVSQNVALGSDPFKIDITVANVQNLGAYDFTLKFNKDILEYVGIAGGSFLTSTGRTANCLQPAPGPNGMSVVDNVNNNGALHFGCTTLGLLDQNAGIGGPSGSGVLASVGFKAKATGNADITFEGLEAGQPYQIRAPQGGDNGEYGQTGLSSVEVCEQQPNGTTDCSGIDISIRVQNGVVAVFDPDAGPTPTGVPATPTSVPRAPTPDVPATVRAVLGTPERRITDGSGAGPAGGSDPGSGGAAAGGGARGTGAAGGASGRSSGALGTSRGASGAPVAGYGPDPRPADPWPGRASAAMATLGAIAIVAGVTRKRGELKRRK